MQDSEQQTPLHFKYTEANSEGGKKIDQRKLKQMDLQLPTEC